MISLAILVVSLVILVETQVTAAAMTREAERMVTATQLAQQKMTDVRLMIEEEGFGADDIYEHGDFEDLGDEAVDLEFGDLLEDYHYEIWVSEVEIGLSSDLGALTEGLAGEGYWGESSGDVMAQSSGGEGGAPDLSAFGISDEMISDMLGSYIREIRIRVWWGDDSAAAEENFDEVVIITHVVNPTGTIVPGATEAIDPTPKASQ